MLATHRPRGWDAEQHYAVVRQCAEGGQDLLIPEPRPPPADSAPSAPPVQTFPASVGGRGRR